jgi:hypothetical protein
MSLSSLSKEEITEIIKGKAKLKNYKQEDDILSDIIYFHFDLKKQLLYDENYNFSIRQIEALLDAISKGKNYYDSLMSIYFARYPKVLKHDLKQKLNNYKKLSEIKPSKLALPKEFPQCYSNKNLIEAVSSIIFSLNNKRNVIIVGDDESGLTQVARWSAKCFNKMVNQETLTNVNNNIILLLCTNNIKLNELIG